MLWEQTSSEHSFLRGDLHHALGYESILTHVIGVNALVTIHRLDAEELCCLTQFLFDP